MTDPGNYKPAELTLVDNTLKELEPTLEKIRTAKKLDDKLEETRKLVEWTKKSVGKDVTGLKKTVVFTLMAEKFYDVGGFFEPSENDKLNFKATDFFFKSFKSELIDFAFERANLQNFNKEMFKGLVIAMAKVAREDQAFRSELIEKISQLLKTEKDVARGSMIMALDLVPLIKASELIALLKSRKDDKIRSDDERAIYGATINALQTAVGEKTDGKKPKEKINVAPANH